MKKKSMLIVIASFILRGRGGGSVSKEAEVVHHWGGEGVKVDYKIIRFINWVDKYTTPVKSLKSVLSVTASSKGCSDAMQTLKMWV